MPTFCVSISLFQYSLFQGKLGRRTGNLGNTCVCVRVGNLSTMALMKRILTKALLVTEA